MVYTVERHKELLEVAKERFRKLGLSNIMTHLGDGSKGWKTPAPFDRIIVTAAGHTVPKALLEQLAEGGVMVIPVGSDSEQVLLRIEKAPDGIKQQHLMPVRFVPLIEGGGETRSKAKTQKISES
jgi:protein-L-isoaspartate(D-aspartate) O-methyltransferase